MPFYFRKMSDQENDIPRQYSTRQETPDIALEREDKKRWNCTIIITVVIEIIILVVVLVLEYFLRYYCVAIIYRYNNVHSKLEESKLKE